MTRWAVRLAEIARAVDECRFTVLVASSAARWDRLAQFAAALAEHAAIEDGAPRLIVVAREFAPGSDAARAQLPLTQRVLIGLDCSDEARTADALARALRGLLGAKAIDERAPRCPYPGLAAYTAEDRERLVGREGDRDAILQRIRGRHGRILVVGASGAGKSSLLQAAVVPALATIGHVVQTVAGGAALRAAVDRLEVPGLGAAIDAYVAATAGAAIGAAGATAGIASGGPGATDEELEDARLRLGALAVPDARRRVIVVNGLEQTLAGDGAARARLWAVLGGLWSLPWCTVIMGVRADGHAALRGEPCWPELWGSEYVIGPRDDAALRAAIVEPGGVVEVARRRSRPHTILFLAANPSGTEPRRLDREARAIKDELERSGHRDQFAFETRWAAEPLDLLRELRKLKPTVVHYTGHGGQDGLYFEGAAGRPQLVSSAAIADTFGAAGASVKLVVLNACHSDAQADALVAHVDCVVGTPGALGDAAARAFAIGFYGGLGERASIADAQRHGQAAVRLEGLSEAALPPPKVKRGADAARLILADERGQQGRSRGL